MGYRICFVDIRRRQWSYHDWLVLWNMNFIFPYIGNVTLPTDKLIFFRGVGVNHQPDGHIMMAVPIKSLPSSLGQDFSTQSSLLRDIHSKVMWEDHPGDHMITLC